VPQYGAAPVFEQGIAPSAFSYAGAPLPVVRRPGYNERYVAWKNRQKAFNRYKKATKDAIKHARAVPANTFAYGPAATYGAAPTFVGAPSYYGGATGFGAPAFGGGYEQFGFPYGQTLAYGGAPIAGTSFAAQNDFHSYSQQADHHAAEAVQQEEPEIRGTQV
jgi:hypothetical protein